MDYTAITWDRVALILVDVQHEFIDGAMPVPGTGEVLPRLADLAELFRRAGRPIVHAIRLYEPGGSDVDPVRRAEIEAGRRVVAPGSHGAQIPAALTGGSPVRLDSTSLLAGAFQQLGPREVVMAKPRWSAFYRTALHRRLADEDVDSVLVAGCNLPNCPRATLFDATERDLRAGIVTDAVSQATAERLADLTLIGVNHVTVADVREHLRS